MANRDDTAERLLNGAAFFIAWRDLYYMAKNSVKDINAIEITTPESVGIVITEAAERLADDFSAKLGIDSMLQAKQPQFHALMQYIYKKFVSIHRRELLFNIVHSFEYKDHTAYDIDKVIAMYGAYLYLANIYNKRASICGFRYMTGITDDTFNRWASVGGISGEDDKVTRKRIGFIKTMRREDEDSLSALVINSPVGIIEQLNYVYGHSAQIGRQEAEERAHISAAALPSLGNLHNAAGAIEEAETGAEVSETA